MLILLPVFLLSLTALVLLIFHLVRPAFKYPWIMALGGALAAFVSTILWQVDLPVTISLPAWQPGIIFHYSPTWLADGTSWAYSLALTALSLAIILTSVARREEASMPWAGTLLLTALGILSVAAGDPLTLLLAWTAIDLSELFTMLRSTEGEEQNRSVIVAFAVRLVGTGFLIGAIAIGSTPGTPLTYANINVSAGVFMLVSAALRLGVFPLHLPYRKENVLRRGFGTSLRLISAAASLIVLARIPSGALTSLWTPYLILLTSLTALFAAWMWVRSSDEILGRPFWILGLASLAIASTLFSGPTGSIGWGITLVLSGGLIFLFSARQRTIIWVSLLGLWGLFSLPFSPSATAWIPDQGISLFFLLPLFLAQGLFITGFIRHALHPGETSLESQDLWVRIFYPAGLLILAALSLTLGLWGWEGSRQVGLWWGMLPVSMLASGAFILMQKGVGRKPSRVARWSDVVQSAVLDQTFNSVVRFLERLASLITSTLEGEGGIFWSILLLVLILSLLSAGGGQ